MKLSGSVGIDLGDSEGFSSFSSLSTALFYTSSIATRRPTVVASCYIQMSYGSHQRHLRSARQI
jgi:hypothetical protein